MVESMVLPLDMNGEPIRGGDVMVVKDREVTVTAIGVGPCEGTFWGREKGKSVSANHDCRYAFHKPKTEGEMFMTLYERKRGYLERLRVEGEMSGSYYEERVRDLNCTFAEKLNGMLDG